MESIGDYGVVNLRTGRLVEDFLFFKDACAWAQGQPVPLRVVKTWEKGRPLLSEEVRKEADEQGSAALIARALGLPLERVVRLERRSSDHPAVDFVFANLDSRFGLRLEDGSVSPF